MPPKAPASIVQWFAPCWAIGLFWLPFTLTGLSAGVPVIREQSTPVM